MKYSKLIISAAIIAATSTCQAQETTINVNVDGLENGTDAILFRMENKGGTRVKAAPIVDGKLNFTYHCDSITPNTSFNIVLLKGQSSSPQKVIYVKENTQSVVTGSGSNPKIWNVSSQHPFQEFENQMDNITKEEYIALNRINGCMDTVSSMEGRKKVFQLRDELYDKIDDKQLALLETMPVTDYYINKLASHTITLIEEDNPELRAKCEKMFNRFSDSQKKSLIGKKIELNLYGKTPTIGDKIIDYDLYDINDKVHHLSDYKGKWLLIDFYTYYCGPCRMIAPMLQYFYSKNGGTDFEIISISQDTKKDFEALVKNEKNNNPAFYDKDLDKGIFALYRIYGYPTFYCVSPDGIIQDHFFGVDMGKITKFLSNSKNFNKPEIKRSKNSVIINNPVSKNNQGGLIVESVEMYKDSTVLNCISMFGNYSIGSSSVLKYENGTKTCKITSSSIGYDNFKYVPMGELGRCRLTFEPLPLNTKEFDYIEGDCETCFRIEGIKTIE